MRVIYSNIDVIHKQIQLKFKLTAQSTKICIPYTQKRALTDVQASLWLHLSFPHNTEIRQLTYDTTLRVESIVNCITLSQTNPSEYHKPKNTSKPSISTQIVYRPITILDPYLLALKRNYYFPISCEPITMTEEETPLQSEKQMEESVSESPISPSRAKKSQPEVITVEHSLLVIADIIKEIEADEAPVQTQTEDTPSDPSIKASSYCHMFALYRKNTNNKSSMSQVTLFKSFAKSVKSADNSIQNLPIRSGFNVHSLSTTDQINCLEQLDFLHSLNLTGRAKIIYLETTTLLQSSHSKS
jgi:hypothetical protein